MRSCCTLKNFLNLKICHLRVCSRRSSCAGYYSGIHLGRLWPEDGEVRWCSYNPVSHVRHKNQATVCVSCIICSVIIIQMLRAGSGAGWRTLLRLWWLTSSSTWVCWWCWWAPVSSCCSWCSGRSVTGTSGGVNECPSSVSGVSAVCSVPPGLSQSFLLKPQKPSSSSSASLTHYKVSFWMLSPFLLPLGAGRGQRRKRHSLCGRHFLWRWYQRNTFLRCVYFRNCCCLTPRGPVWGLVKVWKPSFSLDFIFCGVNCKFCNKCIQLNFIHSWKSAV